ncbi:MAG: phage/plasmid primase, P4 family [Alphaproteobacteria bacterium]|nr:phage/plasmid primase, P4 family [Alphaproteobacteria bacterium]
MNDAPTDTMQPHAIDKAADALEIARLASLSALDYERERAAAAERLGITRLAVLDALVKNAAGIRSNRAVAAQDAPAPFSEDALASAFTARHADELLHVAEWGHWLRWDGARWSRDNTLAVFDLARNVCRDAAAEAASGKDEAGASRIASAATIAAVERLARADRAHARAGGDFDSDPWALNTPGGVVDLRTGRLRPHRRGDLFSKVTAATPAGDCPRWRAFLAEVMQDDDKAQAYLQRWAGYMLTGETREHAFLFVYGPGGNGKGVMMNTLAAALGDYAATAPMETFMAAQHDRHPTDLAGLRGARLVLAQETEAGRALAEAKLKALTGGDRISARFMRGDFFEYVPTFKLAMIGNHRPVIRNPDDAMRRRLHLLPLTFRPEKPDHALPEQLRAELPGILQWAVDGCLAWQREGLGKPAIVKAATDDYFSEQDLIAQWLDERCDRTNPRAATPSSALYRDWKGWAEGRGEPAGSNKAFSGALERLHAKGRDTCGVVKFRGVKLGAPPRSTQGDDAASGRAS